MLSLGLPWCPPPAMPRAGVLPPCVGECSFASFFRQDRQDYLRFYLEAWKQHGDVVRFGVRGQTLYLAVHPEAVRHVLCRNAHNYRKPTALLRSLQMLFGKGLFTTEGKPWQLSRRWAQTPFRCAARQTIWNSAVAQTVEETLSEWKTKSEAADLRGEMTVVALKAICYSLFGVEARLDFHGFAGAIGTGLGYLQERTGRLFSPPLWLPTRRNREFLRAKQILGDVVRGLLRDYRTSRSVPDGLLTHLLASQPRFASGERGEQLLGELLLTLVVAAAESLGCALCWAWLLLAKHPAVQQKLLDELGPLAGKEGQAESPYARLIFQETLRLYPTGWVQPRQALADDILQGYFVPRGTIIILTQYLTHRHPDFWQEPDAFLPERFTAQTLREASRHAYFPFGLGAHLCPGAEFALLAGPLILAGLARRYSLEPRAEGIPSPKANSFFLEPASLVGVRLRERPYPSDAPRNTKAMAVSPAREESCLTP